MHGCLLKTIIGIGCFAVFAVLMTIIDRATGPPHTGPASSTQVGIDLSRSIYLKKDRVLCTELDTLGAYLDGHHDGGEAEGHNRVAELFIHPHGNCQRSFRREQVQVVDPVISRDKLVKVKAWPIPGFPNLLARPSDLEN